MHCVTVKNQDPLLKKERIQKLTETADSLYTYQNKRDKTSFQHDMRYFKDLPGRIAFDKVLCNKAFNIARKPKYDRYQSGLVSMVYNFLKSSTANTWATHALSETLSTQKKFAYEIVKVELCKISVFWA